jgi:transposase
MLRTGLYKEVLVKSDDSCQVKVLLGSRRQLVIARQQLCGTVRGLLKIYGIKIKQSAVYKRFVAAVASSIKGLGRNESIAIEELLRNISLLEDSIITLDKKLITLVKEDKDCKNLMSIPGVGIITALSYKSALDDPNRFEDSETVGAYMGLTPKQYASGEIDRHGRISKMGPKECRSMLYEAAQSLLVVSKKNSKLKRWGLKLAKKKGMKKAIIAVARKLSVIMHRMLIDKTEFRYQ